MTLNKTVNLLRDFSVPLIMGVISALVWANISPQSYREIMEYEMFLGLNLHFLVNDVFMVFFFAMAGVEIVQSLMPGGDLNPINKAINPLFATLGGVIGPVIVYLGLNSLIGSTELTKGWGIPTATDIALAWLLARFIFGAAHPAVKFLLLLAIADDAIGLVIIALFYPDPLHPVEPIWLLAVLAGMGMAYFLRKMKITSYWVYLLTAGVLSWYGLYLAHLHPALALVFIVPFFPHPVNRNEHLFEANETEIENSTLAKFEHDWSIIVDFGLFLFGITNGGVQFTEVGTVTWLVFFSLLIGKTTGVFVFANLADKLGFSLPDRMGRKEVLVAGLVAAMGLTVALFVAGAAFSRRDIQGAAKMGALLSVAAAPIAFALSRSLAIEKVEDEVKESVANIH